MSRDKKNIFIAEGITLPNVISIGNNSIIGYGEQGNLPIIGENVAIGAFCIIYLGCLISKNVEIDHFCRIGQDVVIGEGSKILYGAQLFNYSLVGKNCIIGGDLSERVIVEDNVTFMGSIAHNHKDPTSDWNTTEEPSPVFKKGSVIGVESLIIGGITIGEGAYIGARETIRTSIPPNTLVLNGKWYNLNRFRGFIKSRL